MAKLAMAPTTRRHQQSSSSAIPSSSSSGLRASLSPSPFIFLPRSSANSRTEEVEDEEKEGAEEVVNTPPKRSTTSTTTIRLTTAASRRSQKILNQQQLGEDEGKENRGGVGGTSPLPLPALISRLMSSGSPADMESGSSNSSSPSSCASPEKKHVKRGVLGETQSRIDVQRRHGLETRVRGMFEKKERTRPTTQKEIGIGTRLIDDEADESENESSSSAGEEDQEAGSRNFERLVPERGLNEDLSEGEGLPGEVDEEDESTDLSGFIVDDDAELTVYESSASETEQADLGRTRRSAGTVQMKEPQTRRRRLIRGRDMKKKNNNAEEKQDWVEEVVKKIETIDLTSSPVPTAVPSQGDGEREMNGPDEKIKATEAKDLNAVLHFSPPPPPIFVNNNASDTSALSPLREHKPQASNSFHPDAKTIESTTAKKLTTPPPSPFKAPPRLNSPSKSPNRQSRPRIPQSPHRQSLDAFWSSDIINEWNDQFSPTKVTPLTSPRKKSIARFLVWSDDEDDLSGGGGSSDLGEDEEDRGLRGSSPSPTKPRTKRPTGANTNSPSKSIPSPQKKLQLAAQQKKKREKLQRQTFESTKHELADSFLHALDTRVTQSRLSELTASTGGVKIVWSKTLRSTAGRANWRCTRSTVSSSPVKTLPPAHGSTPDDATAAQAIKHHANIELATKVVTTRSRLLNTLAHEFCHLANFMVSNVRDQPHGPSFKRWADQVTRAFEGDSEFYADDDDDENGNRVGDRRRPGPQGIKVSTKHDYVIDFKYLWICGGEVAKTAGGDDGESSGDTKRSSDEWETWILDRLETDGCGAQYGRHSKSIDTKTQRCGKCRGGLVQVRPRPRFATARKQIGRERERKGKMRSDEKKKSGLGVEVLVREMESVGLVSD